MGNRVTTTQLAEHLSVSRQTLDKAIKAGKLTVAERDARGRPLFDLVSAIREWAEHGERQKRKSHHREGKNTGGRPGKPRGPAPLAESEQTPSLESSSDIASFLDSMRALSPAQKLDQVELIGKIWGVRMAEVKFKEKEGSLIAIEKVRDQGVELATVLLGSLLALPNRLSDQLATMAEPRAINALLLEEVNAMAASVRKHCGVRDDDHSPATPEITLAEGEPA